MRATTAVAGSANAIAGSTRCHIRSSAPSPEPKTGKTRILTANRSISSAAAKNVGTARPTLETDTITASSRPPRQPARTPTPTPTTTMIDADMSASATVVGSRLASRLPTS